MEAFLTRSGKGISVVVSNNSHYRGSTVASITHNDCRFTDFRKPRYDPQMSVGSDQLSQLAFCAAPDPLPSEPNLESLTTRISLVRSGNSENLICGPPKSFLLLTPNASHYLAVSSD